MTENWKIVCRPSFLGKRRDQQFQEWTTKYGVKRWRLAWKVGEATTDFQGACAVYEDAYFEFLKTHPEALQRLITEARDVYDDAPSNVGSGLDYTVQETKRTHIQDIAIRRAVLRLGLWFKGTELIQIRQNRGTHPLSMTLSPGRVPFHRLDLIEKPELGGWWAPGTVEAFYQSNKVLQILDSNA